MLDVLFELDVLLEIVDDSVDLDARKAALAEVRHLPDVFALPPAHDGRFKQDLAARGQLHDAVGDLVHRLTADLPSALGAVRHAHAREQEAEIVVDLRHRAHRGAGVVRGRLLVDGDGGRKPVDALHVRLFHHAEELPGVGRKALHVPPLPLGEDGIEGERALSAARNARKYGERAARDVYIDVL